MPTLIIANLTIREAQRRRILWVALIMGALFLVVFGVGLHYIVREIESFRPIDLNDPLETAPINFLTLAGLYVTNFLVVIMAVLVSVATISSEVESRLIDTVVTKPMRRWQIVLGKWLGFAIMAILYTAFLSFGVLLITRLRTGYALSNTTAAVALICLNAITVMTVSIAGGTRLSTLANGVLAFMLYGLAFVGGWVETIGSVFQNETAVNLGIFASLLMPIEALWRKAAVLLQPQLLTDFNFGGPFAVGSEPSNAMIVYTLLYIAALLLLGMWSFGRRDL